MTLQESSKGYKPFIKWIGGKGQLLPAIRPLYPFSINNKYRYIEPFVGGGAVFFDAMSNEGTTDAVINDINPNLINAYRTVKFKPEELVSLLTRMEEEYLNLDSEGRAKLFYENRESYNMVISQPLTVENGDVNRAALILFLNKTCFNGLYRVNLKGQFNASHGRYKIPNISNEKVIRLASEALQDTTILLGDYQAILPYVTDNTFMYIDPPYRPITKTANFAKYDSSAFDDDSQHKLAKFIIKAGEQGAKVLLSNSDPKNSDPDDNFFDDLYSDFSIQRVPAYRRVSSKATTRKPVNEIIVMNYDPLSL